ncbi:ATP-GRASP peptide maturase of grasp-with-spasm system [Chryseobacterium defluvii]|uniref:ATP-GRASP peptide maturase of grasp-with-spasm system n=1 Tax=Chryseobacterium defluvii TaxID=160396 RepID=A0A840KN33_9FLAO|nr:grasp-with-spasm system ATP-grasp peptide maturase [Chryseobacterium defluvii]MBB4808242.1 ATP-GRASP peptide maturase of grasp-with-spasm system [Chryseobacterium defluvii]
MTNLLSQNYVEITTEEIMDWLASMEIDFHRINGDFLLKDKKRELIISNNKNKENENYTMNDANVVWFRRWHQFEYEEQLIIGNPVIDHDTKSRLMNFLKGEYMTFCNYLFSKVNRDKWIDHPGTQSLNKLFVLEKASELGIKIPETLVTNDKQSLIEFIKIHNQVITKPLNEVDAFEIENHNFFFDTKLVTLKDAESYSNDFFYMSLFQEAVPKKYEIRIFWLDEEFFPMVIFSQRRKESQYDFRVYDFETPDRMIPYKLDSEVEEKLNSLAKGFGYRHCSIDCIINDSYETVFLEINPIGQFGMVSKPCNYYLEKKMAQYLVDYEKSYINQQSKNK